MGRMPPRSKQRIAKQFIQVLPVAQGTDTSGRAAHTRRSRVQILPSAFELM